MLGDDPPYLSVGTEVSAKYKGAFCEAKIRKVVRSVKCRVTYKQGLGTATVADDQIKGTLRVGASVEAKHSERKEFVEATITKIQDCSQYTVVFDDGDITTLRRTALCLKSGRHFAESETLDQLPLTHPEHFGNPVIGGRRGRRSRQAQDESSEDEDSPTRGNRDSGSSGGGKEGMETEPEIGRVVCVELGDKKKKDNWFPGLVVAPTAQDTVRIRVRDDYLVRSFKDARYYTVPKKEATEFTKELVNKVENSTLKVAVEKALLFLEKNELPPHWDRDSLFGHSVSSGNSDSDGDLESDSSDDEPREEKDHFVAQLYKFMDDRGTPINNCPMIGSEDIDLYRLFRAVYKLGGYNRVTNQNQWKSITRRLSFTMQNSPSTHNLVKQAYKKFLHSFEDFYRKLGCTMVNHPRSGTRKQRPGRSLIRDKDRNTPVPPPQVPAAAATAQKTEKQQEEIEEKRIVEDEKKEKKDIVKKEQVKEEEILTKVKKKEEPVDDNVSGHESDGNIEAGEVESISSEKSQKTPALPLVATVPPSSRSKAKGGKEETQKKKTVEKKKTADTKKQEKKDEKSKDEDAAKTRSKSKDDSIAKMKVSSSSSDSNEIRTPSRESERKAAITKQRRNLTDEELKKRGRKRKEYETERSKSDDQQPNESSAPCYKGPVELNDRLKVYYGPTHESKVTYEAKVIDMEKDGAEPMYLVHYTGWNTRYDEWIKASRIAQNFTQAQGRVKRIKATPRPQTPSATSLHSGNLNKSSKSSSSIASSNSSSQSRRRAQSVVPLGSNSSSSSSTAFLSSLKEAKKDDNKEKDKESTQPPRSTTPLSVASSSSRTKSPATPANNRQTRTATRNTEAGEHRRRTRRMSGHTDVSIASETEEDSEIYDDSDSIELEQTKTRSSRSTEERKRREAKCRAEDRIKLEEASEGEDEKDSVIEEPRRGKRLRKTLSKALQSIVKSEPDSDEEQPKGRDFDLNQIRSELKGFDKAVKLELVRVEPDPDENTEERENVATGTVVPSGSPKLLEKNLESPKTEVIQEDTKPPPDSATEDIYEFKEPEPFEFEVRNKREPSTMDKDKVRKRVFEEEPKSPKKKQKAALAPPTIKDIKSVVVDDQQASESRKKTRKLFGKRIDETLPAAETPPSHKLPSQTTNSTCEEAFDKLCESPSTFKPSLIIDDSERKITTNNLDLLFADLPGGDDDGMREDSEDRLIISETEIPETEQEGLFTYRQEMFSMASSMSGAVVEQLNKNDGKNSQTESAREDPISKTGSGTGASVEQKQSKSSPLSSQSSEARSLDGKLLPEVTPTLTSPIMAAPAPISTRLPATASIEEKLSAALAFRNKAKDSKKEEEVTENLRKSTLKDSSKRTEFSNVGHRIKDEHGSGSGSKHEVESKKQQREEDTLIVEEEQRREIMRVAIKQKEEELQQLKLKKEAELKKFAEAKAVVEQKKAQDCFSRDDEWKYKDEPSKLLTDQQQGNDYNGQTEKNKDKHKQINQETIDSADSSDSEQRLVIDNEECQIVKVPTSSFDVELRTELNRLQDAEEKYSSKTPIQKSMQQPQQECTVEFKSDASSTPATSAIKTDEEGETISSLLCEEEIPGSPAPAMENTEQENAGPSLSSPPKIETTESNIVLMEMPFASAPTSGQSTTNSSTVATLSMALPNKLVEAVVPVSLAVQQSAPALNARQQQQQSHHSHLPAASAALMPPQRRESNEAAPVMDNTPPTTPDSSISNISGSPREERTGGSSPTSEDNMKRDGSEIDNDSGSKGGGPGFSEDDTLPNSEANSTDRTLKPPSKKRSIEEAQSPKKRKRNRKHSECGNNQPKKSGRQGGGRHAKHGGGSDSDDDTSEGSNLCSVNPTASTTVTVAATPHTNINNVTDLTSYSSRSPRPTKYNFYVELDPELDGSQRIAVLQQKLAELRKTYNAVKVELAAIERRRKKLRRREREAIKAAKAEMQQACS